MHPIQRKGEYLGKTVQVNHKCLIEFVYYLIFHHADRASFGERDPRLDRTRLQNTSG
jgi:hypothetical protein